MWTERKICCWSPATWTKIISVMELIAWGIWTAHKVSIWMKERDNFDPLSFEFDYNIIQKEGPFGETNIILIRYIMWLHIIGIFMTCLLLLGAITRIYQFLYLWLLYSLFTIVLFWMPATQQIYTTTISKKFLLYLVARTFYMFYLSFVVLLLVWDIGDEKKSKEDGNANQELIEDTLEPI